MSAAPKWHPLIWGFGLTLGATGQVYAQEAPVDASRPAFTTPTTIEPCKLIEGPPDRAGKPQIAVGCGSSGLLLGSGDAAQGQTDPGSGAIAVKLVRFGMSRVFLVTPRIGAGPLLEEITGKLAVALGRRFDLGIGDADVDLTGFPGNLEIRVTSTHLIPGQARASALVVLGEHVTLASKVTAEPLEAK